MENELLEEEFGNVEDLLETLELKIMEKSYNESC